MSSHIRTPCQSGREHRVGDAVSLNSLQVVSFMENVPHRFLRPHGIPPPPPQKTVQHEHLWLTWESVCSQARLSTWCQLSSKSAFFRSPMSVQHESLPHASLPGSLQPIRFFHQRSMRVTGLEPTCHTLKEKLLYQHMLPKLFLGGLGDHMVAFLLFYFLQNKRALPKKKGPSQTCFPP